MVRDAVLGVCKRACECNADSNRFPPTWLFHYRWAGMTTGSIDSAIGRIHFDTVGGHTTAFLPSKQHKGELSTAVPASLKRAAASKNKGASKLSKAAVSVVEEESLSYPEAVREMSTSLPMRP